MNKDLKLHHQTPITKSEIIIDSVKRFLRRGAISHVSKIVGKMHPADIARLINEVEKKDRFVIFELIQDVKVKAATIVEIEEKSMMEMLNEMPLDEIIAILHEVPSDKRADIIGKMSEEKAKDLLNMMKIEDSKEIKGLLKYAEETAGGIMTPQFFALSENTTVQQAIKALQKAKDVEMVFYIYVTDDKGRLVGVISLRQLLLVPPRKFLKDIMVRDVMNVTTDMDQEEVARKVARYNILAIPVVDKENRLVGIITVDDIIDVIKEEATEDIYKMAGLNLDERALDPAFRSIRRRLPWLYVNLVTAILAASVVGLFTNTIQAAAILAAYMPIVAGMGGNAATQTLAVIIRGIALGELTLENARKVLLKETAVGFINGVATGVVMAVIAYLWNGNYMLGVAVGLAMIINLFVAGLAGTLMPFILRAYKIDPAVASSVFVTTFTDISGFFSFLGIATLLIRYIAV
ncbi:MAG: magnesium transporter [Nitrospirota bacterium]